MEKCHKIAGSDDSKCKKTLSEAFCTFTIDGVALLPASEITNAFEKIKARARKVFGDFFNSYFNYIQDYWLNRRGAAIFSVYRIRNRSNNASESYHRTLNEKLSHVRPTVWRFCGKILV